MRQELRNIELREVRNSKTPPLHCLVQRGERRRATLPETARLPHLETVDVIRRAGNLGVPHHFGNRERRQRIAGDDLGRDLSAAYWQHALQHRQAETFGFVTC